MFAAFLAQDSQTCTRLVLTIAAQADVVVLVVLLLLSLDNPCAGRGRG
jgi:hypothetical protein